MIFVWASTPAVSATIEPAFKEVWTFDARIVSHEQRCLAPRCDCEDRPASSSPSAHLYDDVVAGSLTIYRRNLDAWNFGIPIDIECALQAFCYTYAFDPEIPLGNSKASRVELHGLYTRSVFEFGNRGGTYEHENDWDPLYDIVRVELTNIRYSNTLPAVPIPASFPMLLTAISGLGYWRRKAA